MLEFIENRTFDEIRPGDSATLARRLTARDIGLFAAVTGDETAPGSEEGDPGAPVTAVLAHGTWSVALLATVLDTRLPGPGTVYLGQSLRFHAPVRIGEVLQVTVTAREKHVQGHRVVFDCRVETASGQLVVSGEAEVAAPLVHARRPRAAAADSALAERVHMQRLLAAARRCAPLRMAVVHPVDGAALLGAVEARRAGLVEPLLVGPEARIRAVAEAESVDLSGYDIVPAPHSHAAAARAVQMVRAGEADSLMKGSLHTDELMSAVVDGRAGLRTERRVSHVFAFDVPTYPRPLFITDAAVNIDPSLDEKRDIVCNVIELAHALGIAAPRIAILSAVETVTSKMRSTLDAAALCKMADRGQIAGGILDGPLAFDNAVSEHAARAKGIVSPVAGQADVLVVPDLEAGNMLAKQLEYLAGAQAAGLVLGARVPVVLTSRADDAMTRMTSCALASLLIEHRRAAVAADAPLLPTGAERRCAARGGSGPS